MIKTALVAGAAALTLVAGASLARAADAIVEAPVVYDWSGAYIGGQIGGAFGHENDDFSDRIDDAGFTSAEFAGFSMNGFIGGVYGGYNYQTPSNLVVGIEGDFNGSGFRGDQDYDGTRVEFPGNPPTLETIDGNLELKSQWQASIRGRVGYAYDRTLLYGTAGVAFSRAELSIDETQTEIFGAPINQFQFSAADSKTLVGYTVGLGIEHAFTDHWIGKLEGRYSDFGSKTFDLGEYGGDVKADFNQGQVLVGIAYKF